MRALVCERPGEVALRELPDPEPGPGEVVVRVSAALTCGTDFKLIRRGHPKVPFPTRLGHEFAGVVEKAGAGVSFREGERVVPAVSGPCGECPDCLAGDENLCVEAFGQTAWGGFATRVLLPPRVVASALRRVPDGLPLPCAALLDPLASVVRGIARARFPEEGKAVVAGSGPIAYLFSALLRRGGAEVLVAGRRERQLALHARAGARTLDLRTAGLAPAVAEWTSGRGARLVVDTTGDPELASSLLPLVARGGKLMLFAGMAKDALLTLSAGPIHYGEVTVSGSFHYTPREADEALALLAAGAIPSGDLITATRPLADYQEVFRDLSYGDAMKTCLIP
jgi:L-iditol 2-dehydrogenase